MTFKIVADRLYRDGGPVPFVPSPNTKGRMQPRAIVVHDTAGPSAISAINTFKKQAGKDSVSAHIVVDRDGSITQMVEFDTVAFHAGKSTLDGRSGCNSFTVGIEIVNPGKLNDKGCAWFHKPGQTGYSGTEACKTPEHGNGYWLPYTPAQIDAVTELCKALVKAYPTIKQIVPHWHISPRRKIDTNPLFPLEALRQAVFQPQSAPVAAVSVLQVGSEGRPVELAQKRLQELGYPVGLIDTKFGASMKIAVMGFESENGLTVDGKLDASEQAVLHSDKAKAMPIASRESVTVKELAAQSQSTSDLVTMRDVSAATTVVSAGAGVAKLVQDVPVEAVPEIPLDKIAEGSNHVETIARVAGSVLTSLGNNFWIVSLAVGVAGLVLYRKLILRRLREFVSGRWTPSGEKNA